MDLETEMLSNRAIITGEKNLGYVLYSIKRKITFFIHSDFFYKKWILRSLAWARAL